MELHDATLMTSNATAVTDSWWDTLPAAEERGDAEVVRRRDAGGSEPRGFSRRRFVQVGMALGGALALNGLQVISGVKLKPAGATVGTEYTSCANYDSWSGYNNNSLVCVGGPYSYIYCGSDGWFKNGYFDNGNTQYWPVKACGTGGLAARNAWRWSHAPHRYRCCDGYFRYRSNGVWTSPMFKICSQWIGSA